MAVRRLLALVGVGLVVLGTLAAAGGVSDSSPLVSVARTGKAIPFWTEAAGKGEAPSDAIGPFVVYTRVLVNDTLNPGNFLVENGRAPAAIAYDSGKGEVFVANFNSNNVSVISDATNAVVANIPVGTAPFGVAYDGAKHEVLVTNLGSNTVSVISDATHAVVANISVGSAPYGVAYDSGKGEVFVTNQRSNNVSVISDATNAVVANIPVGSTPSGLAYDSGKGEVFVTNYYSNNVSVISDATNAVVANVVVGTYPYDAAYDSTKGEVFVVNYYSNTVSVISDTTNGVVANISVATYPVIFTETGLPNGTAWSITLNGSTLASTTGMITFSKANGTYAYGIGAVPGYSTPSYAGSIEVHGAGVTQTVPWTTTIFGLDPTVFFGMTAVVIAVAVAGAVVAIRRKKRAGR